MKNETVLSTGIDIGTTTTHLIVSRLGICETGGFGVVPSIGANVGDMLPMIRLSLENDGITMGKPFFVRYCRVNTAREIGPLLQAKVVCVLIGERPGLLTDESMSAYIAYKPHPDMSESDYTVVSNISRFGMPPVEAAAYIADVIKEMLRQKASGLRLKL